jgi:hypothetical protein
MSNTVIQTFGANMPCAEEARKFKSEREMRTYFRIHNKRCFRCKNSQIAIYESEDLNMKGCDYNKLVSNDSMRFKQLTLEAETNRPYLIN